VAVRWASLRSSPVRSTTRQCAVPIQIASLPRRLASNRPRSSVAGLNEGYGDAVAANLTITPDACRRRLRRSLAEDVKKFSSPTSSPKLDTTRISPGARSAYAFCRLRRSSGHFERSVREQGLEADSHQADRRQPGERRPDRDGQRGLLHMRWSTITKLRFGPKSFQTRSHARSRRQRRWGNRLGDSQAQPGAEGRTKRLFSEHSASRVSGHDPEALFLRQAGF